MLMLFNITVSDPPPPPPSGATTLLFESFDLFKYFLPLNLILDYLLS
jgi:hypothetical protein